MSLKQDFAVHVSAHLQSLTSIGVPPGLPDQLAEVSTILATYDEEHVSVAADGHLSPEGKSARLQAARDRATAAIEQWKASRTTGIDAQVAAQRSVLQAEADKLTAPPTDLQVRNMVEQLAAFDTLEVEVFYADATDDERRVIEAAAAAIGRQPRRRGDRLVWEPLVSPERVTAVIAERVERANPRGAAALRDSQRIRYTYQALAATAVSLVRANATATAVS